MQKTTKKATPLQKSTSKPEAKWRSAVLANPEVTVQVQ